MNVTSIEWTDRTWNPMSGCEKVSEGCRHCYAHTLAENKRGTPAFPHGFDLTIREHKLEEPLRLHTPSMIFVNSMSDLFWEAVPDQYRHAIIDIMEATPQHQYQVLTKRPGKAAAVFRERPVPDNVWLGVSIESQRTAYRLDVLRAIPAAIRFVSAEPLLSAVILDLKGIAWLIAGGESGSHLWHEGVRARRGLTDRVGSGWQPRPGRIEWVRGLRDQCATSGTHFLFKQWGGPTPKSGGRTLDGRTWNEYPRVLRGSAWVAA